MDYLLGEKNFAMLEELITQKIFKVSGFSMDKKDPFFQKNLLLIATSVSREEIKLVKSVDEKVLVKINNIIIKECIWFLMDIMNKEQEYSSKLEDIEEPEEQEETEIVKVHREIEEPVIKQLKPSFTSEILAFDKETTEANLKNVVSVEFVSCYLDFSDYIVTEYNNCFCINNEEKSITPGNYTPLELIEALKEKTDLIFNIEKLTDNVILTQKPSEKKSITGAIKDQKQYNIDFGVKNSISNLLGFLPKTYILKEKMLISENKHCIRHKPEVKVNFTFDELEMGIKLYTNVDYNQTIHYSDSKIIKSDPRDIKNVNIKMDYNTRGRPYCFNFKFTYLCED
jgi:hypothetical protein